MAHRDYETLRTEVLIVGAGAAGLRTAIELRRHGIDCLVVGKREHGDAHTVWAAGGINASLGNVDPEDRWDIHGADTLKEGHYICDPRAVELLAKHAPERVRELEAWGANFSKTEDGRINQRYFGAQSYRRTCFVGDRTGEAILGTLVSKAKDVGVAYRQNLFISKLLKRDGRVVGAAGFDMDKGNFVVVNAKATVLAAGGLTALYYRSSSRKDENTGDAAALAYEAGATLKDMEFVQFHPTGMIKPEPMSGRLVTEAVRGEGGRLFNREGERFMERYSPEQMELDARDVVARANYQEIQAGRGTEDGGVFLDISHRDAGFIRERLPKIYGQFKEHGVDITQQPMEVAPTAHYVMGGVKIDFDTGETTVPGLFAVGEAVAGVHGANRLGGNSLAETVVFGQIVGQHLARQVDAMPSLLPDEGEVQAQLTHLAELSRANGDVTVDELIDELGELLWDHAGIVRTAEGLERGLKKLGTLQSSAASIAVNSDLTSVAFEYACNLRFMLLAAEAILRGALLRDESRGAHHRSDAPMRKAQWEKNILYARDGTGAMKLWTAPVAEVPPEIRKALAEEHALDYHHLE